MASYGPGDEAMASYSPRDSAEGWEFKVLQSTGGAFINSGWLRAVLEEEKRGGWVLVEILSDHRIRLKRPAGFKVAEEDLASGYDPYRIFVYSPACNLFARLSLVFVVILAGAGALWLLMAILLGRRSTDPPLTTPGPPVSVGSGPVVAPGRHPAERTIEPVVDAGSHDDCIV